MILFQVERILEAKNIENVVVLTSTDDSDDELARLCEANKLLVFRGPLQNVLLRYQLALSKFPCQNIVRLTADCPLIDWDLIDQTIDLHQRGKFDYTSNNHPPTYPDGFDVEVFKSELVKKIDSANLTDDELEHVTLHFYKNPNKFRIGVLSNNIDLSHIRLTVDYEADLKLVRKIIDAAPTRYAQDYESIIRFLNTYPHLLELNNHLRSNIDFKSN